MKPHQEKLKVQSIVKIFVRYFVALTGRMMVIQNLVYYTTLKTECAKGLGVDKSLAYKDAWVQFV